MVSRNGYPQPVSRPVQSPEFERAGFSDAVALIHCYTGDHVAEGLSFLSHFLLCRTLAFLFGKPR